MLLLMLLLAPAARLLAQAEPAEILLHAYALRHQSADDAVALVRPLLSPRGTVELQPAANALVLRDTAAALARIVPVLVAFDHPPRAVDVEIWMVRATGQRFPFSPQPPPKPSNVPPELLRALSEHLPFEHYGLLGSSRVRGEEGRRMTFDIAGDYSVKFRLGTVVADQRLRLNDFEVLLRPDGGEAVPLLRSQLNLWLGRTMVMALSPGEGSSTALMVVVRCRTVAAPAVAATPRPRAASPQHGSVPRPTHAPGGGR